MLQTQKTLSKTADRQRIINDYIAATGKDTIDMNEVAEWAIALRRWKPPQYDARKSCARELSIAARQEFYTDPQGREVRKKHCYTIVDQGGQHHWLWVDIQNARPNQMHKSAAARRRSALGDVIQLATDLASYNDNNAYGAQIEMSFNFDEDLADREHPTEYPENFEGES